MDKQSIIQATEQYVKGTVKDLDSSHDWFHIDRVRALALRIGVAEKADLFIVELGALLHDIADWKFHDGDLTMGSIVTQDWLKKQDLPINIIDHVADVVDHVSYKGSDVDIAMKTIEGKVVQDADRLDAIGAIAIARCFAYGGYADRPIYDPEIKPVPHKSFNEYRKATSQSTSINHFYEKLLLLKDRLHTDSAKKIAQHRHQFVEDYLKEFFAEWEGKV